MKLQFEPQTNYHIKSYIAQRCIETSINQHNNGIIITKEIIIDLSSEVKNVNDLDSKILDLFLETNQEIYLIGTGLSAIVKNNRIIKYFAKSKKTLDFMSSKAACSTFNILSNDDRRVSALIIL